MARYSLVVGAEYKSNDNIDELNDANETGARIHDLLSGLDYDSSYLHGNDATYTEINRRLDLVTQKLQSGDSFLFLFIGRGIHSTQRQYILPENANPNSPTGKIRNAISINSIEKKSAIDGVNRVLVLDIQRRTEEGLPNEEAHANSINENHITRCAENAYKKAPFGILCGRSQLEPLPEDEMHSVLFTRALLRAFERILKSGYEIFLPNLAHLIRIETKVFFNPLLNPLEPEPSLYCGSSILLYPGKQLFPSEKLSGKNKKEKVAADLKLELILEDHSRWLKEGGNNNDFRRLTWSKLKPVFDIYQGWDGTPDLNYRDLRNASFANAEIQFNNSLKGAILSRTTFYKAKIHSADFTKCELKNCNFSRSKISNSSFLQAKLTASRFDYTTLNECIFERIYSVEGLSFQSSNMQDVTFANAVLAFSNFSHCRALDIDFTNTRLRGSVFLRASITRSTFTGAVLYGTARTDWMIRYIKCEYVYWDKRGKEKFPPQRDYENGEFTTENRQYTEFSYTFKEGITPFDLAFATHIVNELNKADLGFEIQIKDVSVFGLNPTLNFIMLSGEQNRDKAKNTFKTVREKSLALETQCQAANETSSPDPVADETTLPALTDLPGTGDSIYSEHGLRSLMGLMRNVEKVVTELACHSKPENVHRKELTGYEYIALLRIGKKADSIPNQTLAGIHTEIENFMPGKCHITLDAELENLPENSYIKGLYRGFHFSSKKDAFFAIAKLLPEEGEQHVSIPVYYELTLTPRSALTQCLKHIRDSLKYKSIEDFNLPALHTTQRDLVCPNGPELRRLRGKTSRKAICEDKYKDPDGNKIEIKPTTLGRAEKCIPLSDAIIQDIACCYGVPVKSLYFTTITPKQKTLSRWRIKTGLSKEELAKHFGVHSPRFFDLLEKPAKDLPIDTVCFLQDRYCRLTDPNAGKRSDSTEIAFEDLIDFKQTKAPCD